MKCGSDISLILLLSISLLFGCVAKKDTPRESANQEATRLIDLGRSEEAIQLLERHLEANPKDIDAAVTLSSAYAQRAGIKFTRFYNLIRQISAKLKDTQSNPFPVSDKDNLQSVLQKLSWNLSRIILITNAFDAIPTIDPNNKDSLKHALDILKSREGELRPKDKAFRILLRAVAVKHGFLRINERGKPSTEIPTLSDTEKRCFVDLRAVDEHINDPGKELIGIFTDLESVQPQQAESFQRTKNDLGETLVRINGLVSQANLLNDGAMVLSRTLAASAGIHQNLNFMQSFGQIIICRN